MSFKSTVQFWHSPSKIELLLLSILTIFSVGVGFLYRDLFIGLGSQFFGGYILIYSANCDGEFLPILIKLLPLVFVLGALILSYILSIQYANLFVSSYLETISLTKVFRFLSHK